MNFDDRTFLFSTSIVMALMAIALISTRKGLGRTAKGLGRTVKGLGSFATANILGTLATILIGLRGKIPFEISYVGGNSILLCSVAFYIVAIRALDARKTSDCFIPLFAAGSMALIVPASLIKIHALSLAVVAGPLGLCSLYCAWHLLRFAPSHEPKSFSRYFCMTGFLGLGLVSVFRAVASQFDPKAELFSNSISSTPAYILSASMSLLVSIGFIMMVNERIQARLIHLATHDPLTGALNRLAFMENAMRLLSNSIEHRQPIAIAMIDLDHFKSINDSHGHQAGDKALERFAHAASSALSQGAMFGRYGGEEFVLALPNCDRQQAMDMAESIRLACMDIPVAEGSDRRLCASIGIAIGTNPDESIDELINRADQALYHAKAHGRNQVHMAP